MIRKLLLATTILAAPPVIANAAYYISPTGSDGGGDGSSGNPWATPTYAVTQAVANSVSVIIVEGGTYSLPSQSNCGGGSTTCLLDLTSLGIPGSGITISYDTTSNANVDTPIWDGGASGGGTGVNVGIRVDSTSHVTISGLTLKHFNTAGVRTGGGTDHLTLKNMDIEDTYSTSAGGAPGGFTAFDCSYCTIENNIFVNTSGPAVDNIQSASGATISYFQVIDNFILDACTGIADCGAIYVQDLAQTATNGVIKFNYIRDGNTTASATSGLGAGIYLDDCASHFSVLQNIVSGQMGNYGFIIHGGRLNDEESNVVDFTTYPAQTVGYETASCPNTGMDSNQFIEAAVISSAGGGGYPVTSGGALPSHGLFADGSLYWSYGTNSAAVVSDSTSPGPGYKDNHPHNLDPLLTDEWDYDFDAGSSPWVNAPVSSAGVIGVPGGPLNNFDKHTEFPTGSVPSYCLKSGAC